MSLDASRFAALLAALASALLLSASAGAASFSTITYDMNGTTGTIAGQTLNGTNGTIELRFASDVGGNILLDGQSDVSLESAALASTVFILGFGPFVLVTGTVASTLVTPVAGGTLASDGTISWNGASATLQVDVNVNCVGSCASVGLAAGPSAFSASSTVALADWTLSTGGAFDPALPQSLAGSLGFTQPFNGNYALIGAESGSRLLALPELDIGLMLTSGIAGLALFGSRRRS